MNKIETKINKFIKLREEIRELSKKEKFDKKTCPLKNKSLDHYELSQVLDGLGCYMWMCPFCEEEIYG